MKIDIATLTQLEQFSCDFAQQIKDGDIIFLQGDLGSGKTTFTQLLLKELGYKHRVKSPTYAIYETYEVEDKIIIHMDLYRLADPQELYYLGLDELIDNKNIIIIEWPDKGLGVLPDASKTLWFEILNSTQRALKLEIT